MTDATRQPRLSSVEPWTDEKAIRFVLDCAAQTCPSCNPSTEGEECAGEAIEALERIVAERDRLRALLKQAHDRDKWMGEFPTIEWYDDVARYFQGKCP